MLRSSQLTAIVYETEELRDILPVHRAGCGFMLCNYSTAERTVHIDQIDDDGLWTEVTMYGTVTLPPYGIGVGFFKVSGDPERLRVRLDARADGDGVFVQLTSPAPRPDHPLMPSDS